MPKRPSRPASRKYRFRIGYEGEYYLMKKFTEKNQPGFYAVRTPGSGTGKVIKPDILAVDDGELYAIEVKSTNREFLYVKPEQLSRLVTFSRLFEVRCRECGHKINPRPVLAIRFLGRGWVFREVEDPTKPIFIRYQEHGERANGPMNNKNDKKSS
jgi:Holliday junction resolvase